MEEKQLTPESIELLDKFFIFSSPYTVSSVASDGSARHYFRIKGNNGQSYLLCQYDDVGLNKKYIELTSHLCPHLKIPRIHYVHPSLTSYIQEDLGTERFDLVLSKVDANEQERLLTNAAEMQVAFHREAGRILKKKGYLPPCMDHAYASSFLRYSQGFFWSLFGLCEEFTRKTEKDTKAILNICSSAEITGFVTNDFQPRNIFVKDGEFFVIDFQDGVFGSLHYDLASLLHSGVCNISPEAMVKLARHLLNSGFGLHYAEPEVFLRDFYAFAILRRIRSLGTYGKLGIKECKSAFTAKIPEALTNLIHLCDIASIYFPTHALSKFIEESEPMITASLK